MRHLVRHLIYKLKYGKRVYFRNFLTVEECRDFKRHLREHHPGVTFHRSVPMIIKGTKRIIKGTTRRKRIRASA